MVIKDNLKINLKDTSFDMYVLLNSLFLTRKLTSVEELEYYLKLHNTYNPNIKLSYNEIYEYKNILEHLDRNRFYKKSLFNYNTSVYW